MKGVLRIREAVCFALRSSQFSCAEKGSDLDFTCHSEATKRLFQQVESSSSGWFGVGRPLEQTQGTDPRAPRPLSLFNQNRLPLAATCLDWTFSEGKLRWLLLRFEGPVLGNLRAFESEISIVVVDKSCIIRNIYSSIDKPIVTFTTALLRPTLAGCHIARFKD